jgi:hypothetical protein
VAPDAAQALLLRLSGLSVVGVVAEQDLPAGGGAAGIPAGMAVVTGVTGARDEIPEGEMVIVDPERGRVLVAPEATAVARLQSDAQKPRPRILLGAAHVPARTQNGVEVVVWAVVRTAEELEAAVEGGADGVVVWAPSDLLPPDPADAEAHTRMLLRVVDAIGGGALGLDASPALVDPLSVVTLAAHCEARWILDPGRLGVPADDLRAEMEALVREERNAERPGRVPLLVADLGLFSDEPADLAERLAGFDEVRLTVPGPSAFDDTVAEAADTAAAASERLVEVGTALGAAGIPFRVWLSATGGTENDGLAAAVCAGAAGVIVEPDAVEATKDRIRAHE